MWETLPHLKWKPKASSAKEERYDLNNPTFLCLNLTSCLFYTSALDISNNFVTEAQNLARKKIRVYLP